MLSRILPIIEGIQHNNEQKPTLKMDNLTNLSTALSILSAMIAPVVLISACASLGLSTANRLARAVDRTRKLLDRFEEITQDGDNEAFQDESVLLYDQLNLATRRSRLLHSALANLYIALSIFIATSIALGFTAIANEHYAWVPLLLGMSGAVLLFYTSILLITETHVSRTSINKEMDFVLRRARLHSPPGMIEPPKRRIFRS